MGFFHTIFLFDGFRSVRASLFGNTLRGGWAIIKSRLCREAAKVGGGLWPPVGVKGGRIPTPVTSVTGSE